MERVSRSEWRVAGKPRSIVQEVATWWKSGPRGAAKGQEIIGYRDKFQSCSKNKKGRYGHEEGQQEHSVNRCSRRRHLCI